MTNMQANLNTIDGNNRHSINTYPPRPITMSAGKNNKSLLPGGRQDQFSHVFLNKILHLAGLCDMQFHLTGCEKCEEKRPALELRKKIKDKKNINLRSGSQQTYSADQLQRGTKNKENISETECFEWFTSSSSTLATPPIRMVLPSTTRNVIGLIGLAGIIWTQLKK